MCHNLVHFVSVYVYLTLVIKVASRQWWHNLVVCISSMYQQGWLGRGTMYDVRDNVERAFGR